MVRGPPRVVRGTVYNWRAAHYHWCVEKGQLGAGAVGDGVKGNVRDGRLAEEALKQGWR